MGVGWNGVMEQEKEQGSWEHGQSKGVCAGEEIKKGGEAWWHMATSVPWSLRQEDHRGWKRNSQAVKKRK